MDYSLQRGCKFLALPLAVKRFIVCATAFCLLSQFVKGQQMSQQNELQSDARLHQIIREVEDNHRFTESDRRFAMNLVDSPSLRLRILSIITLDGAVEAKLFSRTEFFALLESLCCRSKGLSELYAMEYLNDLLNESHLNGPHEGPDLLGWLGRIPNKRETSINAEERRFVIAALASPTERDKMYASDLMVTKKHLNHDTLKWFRFD